MHYFKLFNSCRVVKGAENSLIYDLERMDNSNSIPSSVYEILTEHIDKPVEEIKTAYNNEYDIVIDEYFEFLIKNEYIFYCDKEELELFPTVDYEWKSPKNITNSIIDYDGTITISDYKEFIKELSVLGCVAIQIRSFVSLTLVELKEFMFLFNETSIINIELILKFNEDLIDSEIIDLQKQYPRIRKMNIYSSPEDRDEYFINYLKEDINPENDCGKVDSKFFSIGFDTFAEAQCHNTCLNQKVSVDKNGLIKGCPSMSQSCGDIKQNTINEVLEQKILQKPWTINKDEVEVCKDCEYRYCCTDCRVFTDDKNNPYSRPSKCNYNPYQGLWKGEERYVDVVEYLVNEK
ncbi:MAG: grasp-with-spasm system SPASM domain peptide maturase [Flavobacteriales bacterium]|nr:MAG: grasp-with-spasm system SPASM domain peptide maturase [Flavobacteriales bacterium]